MPCALALLLSSIHAGPVEVKSCTSVPPDVGAVIDRMDPSDLLNRKHHPSVLIFMMVGEVVLSNTAVAAIPNGPLHAIKNETRVPWVPIIDQ